MLKVGDRAPDFSLSTGEGRVVSLASLQGKNVVLYFYPEDDTPTCTTQACELRDNWNAIQETGTLLFGVSPDDARSHQKFSAKYRLPFPLLIDDGHVLASEFGVWGKKSMFGHKYFGIKRTTFVIDGKGVIRSVLEVARAKGHAAALLKELGRLSEEERQ